MRTLRRFAPLAILLCALPALWASGLLNHLSWASFSQYEAVLSAWIGRHPVLAPLAYAAAYAATTALSVPEAAVLTLIGGLMFGTLLGGTMAVIGATVGALVLFLAARSAFATSRESSTGRRLARIRAALQRDGFHYLLAIRLIPAFPFWLVNLAAAIAGMRVLPFSAATLIGIIPATFLYAWIGAGVGEVLSSGDTPDLSAIFSPRLIGPLMALALLALLPLVLRKRNRSDA